MTTTMYTLAGSPPCETARLMLRHKRIGFRERELPPVLSRWLLPRLGFDGKTVPAISLDGERFQGTTTISRALDRLRPERPLFPEDSARRESVVEAEAWGDEVFQDVARWAYLWGLTRDRDGLERLTQLSGLPAPGPLGPLAGRMSARQLQRIRGVTEDGVRRKLAELPEMLDRIDGWIDRGILLADEANAADYQLAPPLATLAGMEDLRPAIEARPAYGLVERYAPDFPAHLSAGVLPH